MSNTSTKPPFPSYTSTWHTSPYPSISPLNPSFSLAGKSIVLTGGGTGIGLAIAKSVSLAGASNLFLIGRRASVLSTAAATISSLPGAEKTTIHTFSADVSNKEQIDSTFASISTVLGGKKIDILISNAGFFTSQRPIGTESVAEWTTNFNVNLLGVYLVVSAFLKYAKPDATIINISSAIVHLNPALVPGFASYAATKMGGSIVMKYVQEEHKDIRVVDIHPGQVRETDMADKLHGPRDENTVGVDEAELPGNFVVWALSDEAKFLKGKFVWANWDVDELKAKAKEIEDTAILTLGLDGFSSFK